MAFDSSGQLVIRSKHKEHWDLDMGPAWGKGRTLDREVPKKASPFKLGRLAPSDSQRAVIYPLRCAACHWVAGVAPALSKLPLPLACGRSLSKKAPVVFCGCSLLPPSLTTLLSLLPPNSSPSLPLPSRNLGRLGSSSHSASLFRHDRSPDQQGTLDPPSHRPQLCLARREARLSLPRPLLSSLAHSPPPSTPHTTRTIFLSQLPCVVWPRAGST
jgi:hypothetical protein